MTTLSMIIVAASMLLPMPRTTTQYPPDYKMIIKIGQCEQPSRGGSGWHHIAWHQTYNYSFLGGLGMTNLNWTNFKRKGQPATMDKATPVEQLWAAYRLSKWVKQNYGKQWIAWDCYTKGNLK